MSRRTEMLGSTIQRELAAFIQREMDDPRLPPIVSVTRVKVTEDLEFADVYVTVMGTPGKQTAALNALKHASGLMRSRLTKDLRMRVAPYLRFQFDEGLKKEMEVLDLLERVRKENEELDRKRAAEAEAAAAAAGGSVEQGGEQAAPVEQPPPPPAPAETAEHRHHA